MTITIKAPRDAKAGFGTSPTVTCPDLFHWNLNYGDVSGNAPMFL
jgi:hypothetical protein